MEKGALVWFVVAIADSLQSPLFRSNTNGNGMMEKMRFPTTEKKYHESPQCSAMLGFLVSLLVLNIFFTIFDPILRQWPSAPIDVTGERKLKKCSHKIGTLSGLPTISQILLPRCSSLVESRSSRHPLHSPFLWALPKKFKSKLTQAGLDVHFSIQEDCSLVSWLWSQTALLYASLALQVWRGRKRNWCFKR